MVDYAKQTLDRAEREKARLLAQLEVAATALQAAVDKLSAAVKEHYDRVAEIDRLRIHVKENILYYMQAIWRQEPPDQRFFRLYNIDVPIVEPNVDDVPVTNGSASAAKVVKVFEGRDTRLGGAAGARRVTVTTKKLVEVADLDEVLALQGQLHGVRPPGEQLHHPAHDAGLPRRRRGARPARSRRQDELSIEELQALATTSSGRDPELFKAHRDEFKRLLIERLTSPRKEGDVVIVPSESLYIECLVGTHPLLEDFKLVHRALDVKKVQAEVRHAELENIRLAARALRGKDEDPDIDKQIVVRTDGGDVTVQPEA